MTTEVEVDLRKKANGCMGAFAIALESNTLQALVKENIKIAK